MSPKQIPVVAIVGRPNVGKSSLFNWLAGRRIAIVEPTAGVTRDRLTALIQAEDQFVELVDTGGMEMDDGGVLTPQVERQIKTAIDQADVILFVVDVRAGLMPLDEAVADRLRHIAKPILCVANKCDTPALEAQAAEFFKLGHEPLVCVSAMQNRGKQELVEQIGRAIGVNRLVNTDSPAPTDVTMKLAIVGRRNTGKSTFINNLARAERMIVSEVPGTTRDSVDVRFERDGQTFIAIDTAGVRRKGSIQSSVEFYSYIRATFPSLEFVPIAFITAKNGKNVQTLLNLAQHLHKQAAARVSTGELNRVLNWALEQQSPPLRQNRRPKIFYATQVGVHPPTLVLFTNGPELFDNTYVRYLETTFRDHLPFHDVPMKLYLRNKRREEKQPAKHQPRKTRKKQKAGGSTRGAGLWKDV